VKSINNWLVTVFNFFVFSSLFIALCAVLMAYQSIHLFLQDKVNTDLLFFIFFATICSYNFHWYLTVDSGSGSERLRWTLKYKWLHMILYLVGIAGSLYFFFRLRQHWAWIGLGAFVTFLYSAPKIPQKMFSQLKKIAIGKTIFLAMVWMYVTTILPFAVSGKPWQLSFTWFAFSRFFLIYAICILFDYRDREDDRKHGIRSMITYFNEKGVNAIFVLSILIFTATTLLLINTISMANIITILAPGVITALLYNYAKRHFSDYLYYFILDGLMMLSALLMIAFRL
jgi:4-hydroxybenzoate polyprenyltransferase